MMHVKSRQSRPRGSSRLNLLLSYEGGRHSRTLDNLTRFLEPMDIRSITADTGEEAVRCLETNTIHIAVIDWRIPLSDDDTPPGSVGGRFLELLSRLDISPPTIVVRPPQPSTREHGRGLSAALRHGAFSVVDRPLQLETMLEVIRRILRRHYADHWPGARTSAQQPWGGNQPTPPGMHCRKESKE